MAYLSYEEYTEISMNPIPEEDFAKMEAAASFTLDGATNYFYQRVDLETDVAFRKNAFKRAVAVTIDYYNFKGGSTAFSSSNYQSVTIGRTTLNQGTKDEAKSPYGNLPIDVSYLLGPTGLLFKGVATSCW